MPDWHNCRELLSVVATAIALILSTIIVFNAISVLFGEKTPEYYYIIPNAPTPMIALSIDNVEDPKHDFFGTYEEAVVVVDSLNAGLARSRVTKEVDEYVDSTRENISSLERARND